MELFHLFVAAHDRQGLGVVDWLLLAHAKMEGIMRNTKLLVTLSAAVWLGLVTQDVWAQANNIARLYVVTPKSGMTVEFETALGQHAQWRREHEDPWTWIVHQVTSGANYGDYVIRSGNHSWSDFDAYDAGFGPEGGVHFNATVDPLVESVSSFITERDTTNFRWPDDPNSVNLLQVLRYHLKPGQRETFFQALNKYHQAIVQTNYPIHYAFQNLVNGGPGPAVAGVFPYENWAAFQGPEQTVAQLMAEVYGQEEATAIREQLTSTFTGTESMVIRVRWDLSVIPD